MITDLEAARGKYQPKLPSSLQQIRTLSTKSEQGQEIFFQENFLKPLQNNLRIGVVFSGGQAPGGHNVITGLYDAMEQLGGEGKLFGFLGGPSGILAQRIIECSPSLLKPYRNSGGFDLLGSGRTKIETEEQFLQAKNTVQALKLDGLVIIGGDDSNTNAFFLSRYFEEHGVGTTVVGVPKTIDGDLKNAYIEASFGFDTAAKTYSEIIGNICKDALSAKKYYHFVKIMGRTASNLALECALQTHPNLTLIGEEIAAKKQSLNDIVLEIVKLVTSRAAHGKHYGVILIPEGLLEFLPRNQELPASVRSQLLLEKDPHGNIQLSKVETERMLIDQVKEELKRIGADKDFNAQPQFCGYEGRAAFPSNFDANYCYALGTLAAVLVAEKRTGYIAALRGLHKNPELWQPSGVPISSLIHTENRNGVEKQVIAKSLVDLKGAPFNAFASARETWKLTDHYLSPGPIQFFGPESITDSITLTLQFESRQQILKEDFLH